MLAEPHTGIPVTLVGVDAIQSPARSGFQHQAARGRTRKSVLTVLADLRLPTPTGLHENAYVVVERGRSLQTDSETL